MKIVTVVGARPQFIKAAAVSRIILTQYASQVEEVLVHTGQHYDANMSGVFFEELEIPPPKYNLEVAGGAHGAMTGKMLEGVERILIQEKPNFLLIYGDTNSTLAGALSAAKLHIPIAHVEAGLRSFNMRMPEEINRVVSDRISSLLFCPTDTAVSNLASEGLTSGVHNVGDVMYDVALFYQEKANQQSRILINQGLTVGGFALATCHRAENTDDPARLRGILMGLAKIAEKLAVVMPLHPRTRKLINEYKLEAYLERLVVLPPLPFLDMIALEQAAKFILTDSGGVQKEAFFYKVPCITMRDETEWVETVSSGWNQLAGADSDRIVAGAEAVNNDITDRKAIAPYGHGDAAGNIIKCMLNTAH